MKNKKTKKLEPGSELYERMKEHLYSKKPILGESSPFSEMLQTMVNSILDGEMDVHLEEQRKSGKRDKRNGKIGKKVITESGPIWVETPRDRTGEFEPQVIEKRERKLTSGLDDQIIALYAQGNSVEDVRRLLLKIFGVEISSGHISMITDRVLPEIEAWRTRQLQTFYPIVYLDAIHFKVRKEGKYQSQAFYTCYSIDWEGNRDLLGIYVQDQEGAGRWGLVLEDLKSRGVEDILVVCTDNLTGFSEVISEVFPDSLIQKCIVHQVRNSLKFVDDKDKKAVARDLRKIYSAKTEEHLKSALKSFKTVWDKKYEYIAKKWEKYWDELFAFMMLPKEMRKMIYTTNPVEALHRIIRKLVKSKAAWVSETALVKQVYLSLMYNKKSWKRKAYGWTQVQRAIMKKFPERIPDQE